MPPFSIFHVIDNSLTASLPHCLNHFQPKDPHLHILCSQPNTNRYRKYSRSQTMPLFGFTKKEGEEVKEKIANDINPGEASGLKHNKGKPKKAPYSTQESSTARFLTNCAGEHKASLKCIEENYSNRAACQPFFDTYKECRAEENEKRKASNSGGTESKGFFSW